MFDVKKDLRHTEKSLSLRPHGTRPGSEKILESCFQKDEVLVSGRKVDSCEKNKEKKKKKTRGFVLTRYKRPTYLFIPVRFSRQVFLENQLFQLTILKILRLDFCRLPGPVLIPRSFGGMSAGSFSRTAAGNRAYKLKFSAPETCSLLLTIFIQHHNQE